MRMWDSEAGIAARQSDILLTINAELRRQLQQLPTFAEHDLTVLITGETGTGKELIAREIHRLSPRAAKIFVPVNCGALPGDLIENEFFGHESEAFTGASSRRPGLVTEAQAGTLFLDEIDSAPLPFQAKLLRLLQNHEFRPVGSTKVSHADVRVIAAANSDLESAVREGKFREDLYYRINILRVALPSLRDRAEDIPLLAKHFLQQFSAQFKRPVQRISDSALSVLCAYRWPGNVRELENVIQRAVILCNDTELAGAHIDLPSHAAPRDQSFRAQKAAMIQQFERNYLLEILSRHRGNIAKAARAAGKHRRAFFELMKKHRIQVARSPVPSSVDISVTRPDNSVHPHL
jgi:two-component system, NtrC family, response regulator GlrR